MDRSGQPANRPGTNRVQCVSLEAGTRGVVGVWRGQSQRLCGGRIKLFVIYSSLLTYCTAPHCTVTVMLTTLTIRQQHYWCVRCVHTDGWPTSWTNFVRSTRRRRRGESQVVHVDNITHIKAPMCWRHTRGNYPPSVLLHGQVTID